VYSYGKLELKQLKGQKTRVVSGTYNQWIFKAILMSVYVKVSSSKVAALHVKGCSSNVCVCVGGGGGLLGCEHQRWEKWWRDF